MTPRAHFVSLTKTLKGFREKNDPYALKAYLVGAGWDHLMGLRNDIHQRVPALRAFIETAAQCQSALDARAPIPRPGYRRVQWNDETISRFRRAFAKGGVEGAARELCISRDAASLARRRYCRAPIQPKTADVGAG